MVTDQTSTGATLDGRTGRRLAIDVHEHVRELILDGTLEPGTAVSQAVLARSLGVSRTPMREAFRMLQEEGLIDAAPDQRARVRVLDPATLDQMYGTRILLETLAVKVTLPGLAEADLDALDEVLALMSSSAAAEDWQAWRDAHRRFHRIHSQAMGGQVHQIMSTLAEHSSRYVNQNRVRHSDSIARAHAEHVRIAEALREGSSEKAVEALALHLASTALATMADVAPTFEPVTIRMALRTVLTDNA